MGSSEQKCLGCIPLKVGVIIVLVVEVLFLIGGLYNSFIARTDQFNTYVLTIIKIVFTSLTICCLPKTIWPRIVAFVLYVISAILSAIATIGAFLFKAFGIEPTCDAFEQAYEDDSNFRADYNEMYNTDRFDHDGCVEGYN